MVTENIVSPAADKITGRYTLLTHIPVFVFDDGSLRTDPLWEKDLSLHFEYIDDLHLACPVLSQSAADETNLAVVEALTVDRVHHVGENIGWSGVLKNLAPHFFAMGRVARDSDIVHGGAAGWPFPLSFYLLFWRHIYRFQWVMVVESSFWRLESAEKASLRKRIAHISHMWLVPMTLRRADARIFTQDEYRRSLLREDTKTLVAPAVWYNPEHLETLEGLARRHEQAFKRTARVLFPTRMTADKGVDTVIAAVSFLEENLTKGEHLSLDFIGDGDMKTAVTNFVEQHTGKVQVRLLDSVPYGRLFFDLLRKYDAILVANRKAEQPRIIFDAFSQGVPAIVSRTSGILDCVRPGVNAETFEVNAEKSLADLLVDLTRNTARFQELGRAALANAQDFTHRGMHEKRYAFFRETLQTVKHDE